MENRYSPPASDLIGVANARPGLGWRIYAWGLAGLAVLGIAEISSGATRALDYVEIPAGVMGTLGVLGYAHGGRVGPQRVWRFWAVAQPIWDAFYTAASFVGWTGQSAGLSALRPGLAAVSAGIGFAVYLPAYVALFRYGYRSQALWAPHAPSA